MLKLTGRKHAIAMLAFSSDGRYLAAAGYRGGVHVWDTVERTLCAHFEEDVRYYSNHLLTFLPQNRVFWPSYDAILVGDVVTQKLVRYRRRLYGWIVPNPDGESFLHCYEGQFEVFAFEGKNLSRRWQLKRKEYSPPGEYPTFMPDGKQFLTIDKYYPSPTSLHQQLTLRQVKDGELVAQFTCPSNHLLGLAVSADGQHIYANTSRSIVVWNRSEPKTKPKKFTSPSKKHLTGFAVHPAGQVLATVDNERLVRLWDTETFELCTTLEWDIGKLYAVAFSPDGLRAAVGSGRGTVLVWDVE